MTPGMVSKRLAHLESKLGLRLFHRTTRSVQPTEEGRRLYSQASALFEIIETYESDWGGIAEPQGVLRVSASASFARLYLTPVLASFLERYPKIEIKLDLTDRMIDIIEEGIDVAIRISVMNDSSLIARKIGNGERLLCATKDYLLKHPPLREPADLAKHNCLVLNGKMSWDFETDKGILSQKIKGNLQCNYGEAVIQCIKESMGIGIASYWHVKDDLKTGKLQLVLPQYKLANNPSIFAVYPSRKFVPLRTRAFVEHLEKNLVIPTIPENLR